LGDAKRGRLSWSESDIEAYIARKSTERDRQRLRIVDGVNVVELKPEPVPVRFLLRRPTK
jgi:hypothetical protein